MGCERCLLTSDLARINNGVCEFCETHDELEKLESKYIFDLAHKLRKKEGYHVLLGISGGLDSSYLLWYTVTILGLKPLCLHFNNKWNTEIAEDNMSLLVKTLGVDLIRITSDDEYDRLCTAFLRAGVKDLDIPNDMYMAELMQSVARKYKIKYVFNGHDFRAEGSVPLAWTYMDARYMRDVFKKMTGERLKAPVQTFWKQIIRRVRHVRVFHYINISPEAKRNTLLRLGIKDYGLKHAENFYTEFIGYYVLPHRWGIDKRLIYNSAKVRSGFITRDQATFPEITGYLDLESIEKRLGIEIDQIMNAPKRTYKDFRHYHFKRWRFLIWIMAKLQLVSYNFYRKYAC